MFFSAKEKEEEENEEEEEEFVRLRVSTRSGIIFHKVLNRSA